MSQQKILITESPQYTDAGQTAIAGCLDIHIAVTNIHSMCTISIQLP